VNTLWKPRISLRADIASGDKDARDAGLQSFNPLFPGNSYAGAVGLFGPTNLTDLTPGVTALLTRSLVLGFEAPSYWRTSSGDGLYATDQRVLLLPESGKEGNAEPNPGALAYLSARQLTCSFRSVPRLCPAAAEKMFCRQWSGFYLITALYRF
jgi:hypothetical protein